MDGGVHCPKNSEKLKKCLGVFKYELRKQRIVWEWGRQKMKQFEIKNNNF